MSKRKGGSIEQRYAEKQRVAAYEKKRATKQMSNKPPFPTDQLAEHVRSIYAPAMAMSVVGIPIPKTKEEMLVLERDRALAAVNHYRETLARIDTQQFAIARVAAIQGNRVILRAANISIAALLPAFKLELCDMVLITTQTNQIVAVVETPPDVGVVATVSSVTELGCEVQVGNVRHAVIVPPSVGELKSGDHVLLDDTLAFVLRRAVRLSQELELDEETGISWDDIGGHEEAKESLREAIEYPIRFGALYRGYSQRPSKGVLLYGPPGTGKTMLARAAATALRDAHGGTAPGGFIAVAGPELLNKFVGESERGVRDLFTKARAYRAKTGHPAVIFIDEADALLGKRSGIGRTLVGMEQTIVPAFLAEMDGMEESAAFVILATNRADVLDHAVVRDGRIDRKIHVGRPSPEVATKILWLSMRGRPVADGETLEGLLESAIRHVFDDGAVVKELGEHQGKSVRLLLRDVVSGALLAGIANRATTRALRRDREAGAVAPSGITGLDLAVAVRESAAELAGTDLQSDVVAVLQRLQASTPIVQEAR